VTDRQLLELAAKAAGIPLIVGTAFGEDAYGYADSYPDLQLSDGTWVRRWNPLEDDGDALRLAVKLHLYEALKLSHRLVSGNGVDAFYAAARLAIVRAAAEIGSAA
jgi:hypothetical protein